MATIKDDEIGFRAPGPVDTNAFALTMLCVLLHKSGGDVTITEGEYNAAFADGPKAIVFGDCPKGSVRLMLGEPHDGPVCADRGDGFPICYRGRGDGGRTVTRDCELVTCPICKAAIGTADINRG